MSSLRRSAANPPGRLSTTAAASAACGGARTPAQWAPLAHWPRIQHVSDTLWTRTHTALPQAANMNLPHAMWTPLQALHQCLKQAYLVRELASWHTGRHGKEEHAKGGRHCAPSQPTAYNWPEPKAWSARHTCLGRPCSAPARTAEAAQHTGSAVRRLWRSACLRKN